LEIESQRGIEPQTILDGINRIVRLTLISIQPILAANYHVGIQSSDNKSRLFEILGFDILLDENGRPWLLEVNSMPSLSCGSPFDRELKTSVIKGAVQILDLRRDFKRKCKKRMRKIATQRMSGLLGDCTSVFDPQRESRVSETTNWHQIFPVESRPIADECTEALGHAQIAPLGGVIETATTRKRKEAVIAQMNEQARRAAHKARPILQFHRPLAPLVACETRVGRTPKAVLLADGARAIRMQAESQRSAAQAVNPLLSLFGSVPPVLVLEAEERERLRVARTRMIELLTAGVPECIRAVLPQQEAQQQRATPSRAQTQFVPGTGVRSLNSVL
jgi:tubulin polyglutamylase TTLL6/13